MSAQVEEAKVWCGPGQDARAIIFFRNKYSFSNKSLLITNFVQN